MAKRLQVPTNHIQSMHVEGESIQVFKDSNITMEKCMFHSYFHAIYMNVVDIILGYYWKYYVGIVDVNVQMEF